MSVTRLYDDTVTFAPQWNVNYYYTTPGGNANTVALAIGATRSNPIYIPRALTIDRIGAECTTATDADACFRLGIYTDDGTHTPGALLKDCGLTAALTPAAFYEITLSPALALGPGLYWLCCSMQRITQVATAYSGSPSLRTTANNNLMFTGTTSSLLPSQWGTGFQHTILTSGGLPTTATSNGINGLAVRVFVRCAS